MLKEMDTRNDEATVVKSIGKLGVSRRSYDRLYVNGTRFSSDPTELAANFHRLVDVGKRHEGKIGRSIFRGLVSSDVIKYVLNSDLRSSLEVALPVGEFTGDSSWLVYMADNRPGREGIDSSGSMLNEVGNRPAEITYPLEKIKSAVNEGYDFVDRIGDDQVDQLLVMWGETFGWKREGIKKLQERLLKSKLKPLSERDVWFSAAVTKDNQIVSAAMAERLSIPKANGGNLDLVESTEWKTEDKHAKKKLTTPTLDMLNAQVLSDLAGSPNGLPLIFAECNLQSAAGFAGQSAGLRIPDRAVAPQILTQNVLVRDNNHEIGDSKLRDFAFMYLPKNVIDAYYNEPQVEVMKAMIKV
ncbi:MAG: hypothetical protein Q7R51_02475 [bacterium]|nr:hypothetical protein [bacterium]